VKVMYIVRDIPQDLVRHRSGGRLSEGRRSGAEVDGGVRWLQTRRWVQAWRGRRAGEAGRTRRRGRGRGDEMVMR
jgi:hypothetical protein